MGIFSVKVDGEEIVLSVFDTAGQEEYDQYGELCVNISSYHCVQAETSELHRHRHLHPSLRPQPERQSPQHQVGQPEPELTPGNILALSL